MEKNETEIETTIREVKEETNIDIEVNENLRYSIEYNISENKRKQAVYFVATPKKLNFVIQPSELNSASWVDIDKVYDKLTFENAKEMWLKVKKDINDFLALYDENNNLLNEKILRKEKTKIPVNRKFKIVLIYIKNSDNKYLIQKCSKEKGGVYATTGGHVDYGNNSIQTAIIEIEEELGIKVKEEELEYLKTYKYEKVFSDIYLLEKNIEINDLKLQTDEVEKVYWMNKSEIKDLINKNVFRKGNIESFNELILEKDI